MIIFVSMAKGLFVICLAMKFIKSKNICQKANKHIFLQNNRGAARISFHHTPSNNVEIFSGIGYSKNVANKRMHINFTFA